MTYDQINHVAIIPDGNRRWAKQRSLDPSKGHEAGFEALRNILKESKQFGIKVLSFYAFSTENFNRTQTEVNQLFYLLERVLDKFSKELKENNIQLRISGSEKNLSSSLLNKLKNAQTLCNQGDFILNICFNYGSQEELVNMAKQISVNTSEGKIKKNEITKEYIDSLLWTVDLPPVDLLIRTSGEYRISNFMLWQCAYAEFYFSDKFWPDFTLTDFEQALNIFNQRHRRYGK